MVKLRAMTDESFANLDSYYDLFGQHDGAAEVCAAFRAAADELDD